MPCPKITHQAYSPANVDDHSRKICVLGHVFFLAQAVDGRGRGLLSRKHAIFFETAYGQLVRAPRSLAGRRGFD